jgi:hypothetical protein
MARYLLDLPVQTNSDRTATAQHLRDGLIRVEGPPLDALAVAVAV